MNPPSAAPSPDAAENAAPQPRPIHLEVMRKRADFLAAARSKRINTPGFVLQIRNRRDDGPARVGFTCSKKVGNAVARNRAKRRLREIARLMLPKHAKDGHDYVLIGRAKVTAQCDFEKLLRDLSDALSCQAER